MDIIIKDLQETISKKYADILKNNPKKEFIKFLEELNEISLEKQGVDIVEEIIEQIERRILTRKELSDIKKGTSNFSNELEGVRSFQKTIKYFKNNKSEIFKKDISYNQRNELYYILYITRVITTMTYPTITYTNLEDFKYLLKSEDLKKNSQVRYFRGQSNSKWNLIPSIFRNIEQNETSIFNFEKLWDKYKKQGFLGMYNKYIDKDSDEYTTISFLQHAISYSPLIDFSSNLVIATFFALNNYKDNDFLKTDSAIFIIVNVNAKLGHYIGAKLGQY